jgi:hypothetical protein
MGENVGDVENVVWYISRDNNEYGPFNRDDFQRFEREYQLISTDLVWYTGQTHWIAYRDYKKRNAPLAGQPPSPTRISRIGGFYVSIRAVARLPISLIKTAFSLITAPTSFGRERIDRKFGDLQRATTFFLNLFALVFLSFSASAYLQGFSGASEVRELVRLGIQCGIAFPILYLLNIAARQPVRFTGIMQAVLYADALLLIATVPANALTLYLTPLTDKIGSGELDIISTEYEKCLASQSIIYWLIRGDLEFFIRPAITQLTTTIEFIKEHIEYFIAPPFCLLFAKLLKGRYGANSLSNTIFAALAFVIVNAGWQFTMDRVQRSIVASSTCAGTFFKRASEKYSTQILGNQIAHNVNQQLARNLQQYRPGVSFVGDKFVMHLTLRPGKAETSELRDVFERGGISYYCENNTAFRYARELGIPLQLIVQSQNGSLFYTQQFTSAKCPTVK